MEIMLTVSQTALIYNISDRTVRRMIKAGKITAVEQKATGGRCGMVYFVPLEELPPERQARYAKLVKAGKMPGEKSVGSGQEIEDINPPCRCDDIPPLARGIERAERSPQRKGKTGKDCRASLAMTGVGRGKLDYGAGFGTGRIADEIIEDKQRTEELIAQSGRPRNLEECSAAQREEIRVWRDILDAWNLFRVKGSRSKGIDCFVYAPRNDETGARNDENRNGGTDESVSYGDNGSGEDGRSRTPPLRRDGGTDESVPYGDKGSGGDGGTHTMRSLQSRVLKSDLDKRFIELLHIKKGIDVTEAALYRKWNLLRLYGDVGLVDMRGRLNRGKVRMPQEIWERFEGYWLDENRLTLAKCVEMTQMWTSLKKPELMQEFPHYSSFYRASERIPHALTMIFRYGDKAFEDEAAPYVQRIYDTLESNDIWVADNHTLDIISQDGSGTRHRLHLTAYIDARARIFTGWNICNSPNSESNLTALRKGILRCGIPKAIYVDNGMEFLVSDIGGRGHRRKSKEPLPPTILDRLGIKMTNALPRNAKAKVIERQFKELAQGFSAMFDSYINSNPVARSEKSKHTVKADDLILDSNIVEYIDTFLEGYYNQKPHYGAGMNGKAPQQVWTDNLSTKRMASAEELNLMLLRTSRYQKVGRNGVKLELYGQTIWYFDNEFLFDRQGQEVYVRYDPNDLTAVRVYDIEDRFIGVVGARSELILEYGADKEKIKEAMQVKRSYKKYVKERFADSNIQLFTAADRLDVLLQFAEGNRKPLEVRDDTVLEMVRHSEEAADMFAGRQAVGDEYEGIIDIGRMLENAKKGRREE